MIEQLKISFSTMNEYLEPKVFLYCLYQLWKLFLSVFEEQISNQDLNPEPCTDEERDLLFRIFMPVLWNLFSQGLEEQLMIESSRKLSMLILSSRKGGTLFNFKMNHDEFGRSPLGYDSDDSFPALYLLIRQTLSSLFKLFGDSGRHSERMTLQKVESTNCQSLQPRLKREISAVR